jgi:hypothetical protein
MQSKSWEKQSWWTLILPIARLESGGLSNVLAIHQKSSPPEGSPSGSSTLLSMSPDSNPDSPIVAVAANASTSPTPLATWEAHASPSQCELPPTEAEPLPLHLRGPASSSETSAEACRNGTPIVAKLSSPEGCRPARPRVANASAIVPTAEAVVASTWRSVPSGGSSSVGGVLAGRCSAVARPGRCAAEAEGRCEASAARGRSEARSRGPARSV